MSWRSKGSDFLGVMFCPLCRNAMNYEKFEDTYRCSKTDFHPERNVVVTVGLTRFKGSVLKQNKDIEKSHVLLILKNGNGSSDILSKSNITVHSKHKSVVEWENE